MRIAPPPWASRISDVSLRAIGSGKLSETKASLPRVVMTTGPSSVEYTCSTEPSPDDAAVSAVDCN